MIEKLEEYSIFGIAQQAYGIVDEGLLCLDNEGNDFVVTHDEITDLDVKIEMVGSGDLSYVWKCSVNCFVADSENWILLDQRLTHSTRITGMPVIKRLATYTTIIHKYFDNRRHELRNIF